MGYHGGARLLWKDFFLWGGGGEGEGDNEEEEEDK